MTGNNPINNSGGDYRIIAGRDLIGGYSQSYKDYNTSEQGNLAQAAAEIQQLINQLEQLHPTFTTAEKIVVATEVIQHIESNPTLKTRLLNVLKVSGIQALEQALNHPTASFVIAALQDWQKWDASKYGSSSDIGLDFLRVVLQTIEQTNADPQVVYPLLHANLDRLDDSLIQELHTFARTILPGLTQIQVQQAVVIIADFSTLICQFPLGNKDCNIEIAITGYEIGIQVITREAFPEQWAMLRNNLGGAYLKRIRGERAENIELAIACYQSALKVYTREVFSTNWATTQNNLGTAYSHRILGDKAQNLEQAISCFQAALQVYTREAFRQSWVETLMNLGNAYRSRILGDRAKNLELAIASHEQALAALQDTSDRYSQVKIYHQLASILQLQGKLDEAQQAFERGIAIAEALNDQSSLAIGLNRLGGLLQQQGKLDEAQHAFERGIAIAEALNDQSSLAIGLNRLGELLQQQGKFDEAQQVFERQIAIAEALDDQSSLAIGWNRLGGLLQQQGKLNEAQHAFERGIAIAEALNDLSSLAIGLNCLGGLLLQQGKFDEAQQVFKRQIAIAEALNDQSSLAIGLNRLGELLQQQGRLDEAVVTFQRVVEISQALDDQGQEVIALHRLSGVLEQQQKWHEAEMILRRSYNSSQKIGDKRGQAISLNSLGQVLSRQDGNENFELSLMFFRASIKLGEELEDQTHLAQVYTALGQALLRHGQTEEAVTKLSQGFEIDENSRNSSNLGKVTPHLTDALVKLGKREEALAYCQRALAVAPKSKKLQKLQKKLSSSQRKVLERRQTLAYGLLLTVSPKVVLVGGELEVAIHLSLSGTNSSNSCLIQVPQNEIVGSDLNIILTASGFQIDGDNAASLPLDPNTDNEVPTPQFTQTCRFRLTALRPGSATITAELYRGDIFQTNIENNVQVAEFDEAGLLGKRITTQPRPVPQPDFILKVQTAWNETKSACRFHYQLRSFRFPPLFPGETNYHSKLLSSSWIEQMRGLLGTTLENISEALPEDGRSRLTSLGHYLFQHLIPTELQTDFRSLIPRDRTFTLLILADQDASLPWELLHDGQRFLSERFIIGRWFWELNDTRPHEFPVGAINVAHYADVEQPQLWTDLLEPPGSPPPLPLPEGVLGNLDSTEAMRGLHLIRYSQSSDAANRCNAPITLDDTNNAQDIERQMRPAKLNLRRNRPLVSLGYVRRDRPELTTLEQTWGSAFIRAGCSAFTGSLWAVDPAVEAAFISSFYNRLWTGDSLGEAFHASRQLARAVAPDSLDWLAYVLFGDPMARPYRPIEGKGYAVVEPIGREIDDPLPPGVPVRFRLSLRRTPPVWHEERVIEVAENLTFENLQAHVKTFGLQVTPDSPIAMSLAPTGNYLGWFTLVAPPEMAGNSALVQVFLMDGMQPIHSLMFSLNIENEEGSSA
jgi:tetratricopeptide (TPR) repeat protein